MQTIKKFSGSTSAPANRNKFDFESVATGQIYRAVHGKDYTITTKGFVVAMSRWAKSTNHTLERFVADDGSSVEFRLTPPPVPEPEESTETTEPQDAEQTEVPA